MTALVIGVTLLGSGSVSELVAQRVNQRKDLKLLGVLDTSAQPSSETQCVVYLPSVAELQAGAAERIYALLKSGLNVVTTLPASALSKAELMQACREGKSSFHGTGGFQCSLATRVNRAFASITRNIKEVELIEEMSVPDVAAAAENARMIESFYDSGIRYLAEAVFSDSQAHESVQCSEPTSPQDDQSPRQRNKAQAPAQRVVQRNLGEHVIYDSIWTQAPASDVPLQYRLKTTSTDAIGHVTISFHAEGSVSPMDHLTSTGILEAIRPVFESAPGILHHELNINYVKPDDRLAL